MAQKQRRLFHGMNLAVGRASRKVGEECAYVCVKGIISSICGYLVLAESYNSIMKRYEIRKKRRIEERFIRRMERKAGRKLTLEEAELWPNTKPSSSESIHFRAKPNLSDEEQAGLTEKLLVSLSSYSSFETIESLLDQGAKPDAEVLGLALYKYGGKAFDIYDLLLSSRCSRSILIAKDHTGYTPLMWAAKACHLDACKWLVQRSKGRLNFNDVNSANQTALDIVEEYKPYNKDAFQVYDYLVSLGAKHSLSLKERIKRLDKDIEAHENLLTSDNTTFNPTSEHFEQELKILKDMRSRLAETN